MHATRVLLVLCLAMVFAAAFASTTTAVPSSFDLESYDAQQPTLNQDERRMGVGTSALSGGGEIFALCASATYTFGSSGGTDCWGWEAPDGTEYAIMGVQGGIAFVDVTNGSVADVVPGSSCNWQDMATYQNYCYAVSECGTGLRIFDLQYLPDSARLVDVLPISIFNDYSSHNLSIDTVTGHIYIEGTGAHGVYVHSLANPEAPQYLNTVGDRSNIHDMWASNDTVMIAEGSVGTFSIWNAADKQNITLIARVTIPSAGYVHNIWPTDDRRHAVTTEETSGKTVKIWNIEDPSNIQLVGEFLGPSGLAHNAHVVGDTVFASHYESGVIAVDISNPSQPNTLFQFDTYPGEDPGFNGCWGVFPHTRSGKVYASNRNGVLYILEPQTLTLGDGLVGDSVVVSPGQTVRVDVSIDNAFPIEQFTVPISWSGDFGLTWNSVSVNGLRTDGFTDSRWLVYDPSHGRLAIEYNLPDGAEPLPPGSGPILSIYFQVPFSPSGDFSRIDFDQVGSINPSVKTDCFEFNPTVTSGWVALPTSSGCCAGTVGNVDDDQNDIVDVGDITYLIGFLFNDSQAPACLEEANADGSADGIVDVGDLTALIDFLFLGGPAMPSCP